MKTNSNFLDDQLFDYATKFHPKDVSEANLMIHGLYRMCDEYKLKNLPEKRTLSDKEIKVILDRLFNIWDSFIRMLSKGTNSDRALLTLIQRYKSYKEALMFDVTFKSIYESL